MNSQQQNVKFYIPVEFKEEVPKDFSNKTFIPTTLNSIFIPSLPPAFVDEHILTYLVQEVFKIGSVKRVDIIKKDNVPNRLMAFIHFNCWYDFQSTHLFREMLLKDGQVDMYGYIDKNHHYVNYNTLLSANIKKDTFLRFMINKTPIKDTELNIHQLADLLEKADEKITSQDSLIKNLQLELMEYKLKVENLNTKVNYLSNELSFEQKIKELYLFGDNRLTKVGTDVNVYSDEESDNISEIDDFEEMEIIEKPKLIRENYLFDNSSMQNFYNKSETNSLFEICSI